ncbi:MAG: hypothetical protein R3Y56_01885 [Akkermansia sp.]
MNISSDTPQVLLCKLTQAATRAHILSALPITGRGLRTSLLFILFPGMLFGFWQGLVLTGLVTLAMMAALALDDPNLSLLLARGYLIWGCVTAFGVAASVMLGAIREAKRRREYLQPACEGHGDESLLNPQQKELRISAQEQAFLAELEIEVPAQGVYAFIMELQDCDWAGAPLLQQDRHACMLEWRKKERLESLFFAYRLEPGVHQLSMKLGIMKRGSGRPKARLTQINQVQ